MLVTLAIFSSFTTAPGTQPRMYMDSDLRSTILRHCRQIRLGRGTVEEQEVEYMLILISMLGNRNL